MRIDRKVAVERGGASPLAPPYAGKIFIKIKTREKGHKFIFAGDQNRLWKGNLKGEGQKTTIEGDSATLDMEQRRLTQLKTQRRHIVVLVSLRFSFVYHFASRLSFIFQCKTRLLETAPLSLCSVLVAAACPYPRSSDITEWKSISRSSLLV